MQIFLGSCVIANEGNTHPDEPSCTCRHREQQPSRRSALCAISPGASWTTFVTSRMTPVCGVTVCLPATYSLSEPCFYKQASGSFQGSSAMFIVVCVYLSTTEDGKPWVLVFLHFHIFLLCIVNNGAVKLQKARSFYFASSYMQWILKCTHYSLFVEYNSNIGYAYGCLSQDTIYYCKIL